MKYNFTNKKVVITGTSRGIGETAARAFLDSGAHVIGISRSGSSIQHDEYEDVVLDITNTKELTNFIEKVGNVDVWLNNAGIYPQSKLEDVSEEEVRNTIETNFIVPTLASKYLIQHLNEGGSIINIGSFASSIPSVGSGVYAASKAALKLVTRSMAAEWAKYGVRVNSISPGVIETEMTRGLAEKKDLTEPLAIKRPGTSEDVVAAILFLCSDDASYITGADIPVTGGKYLVQNQHDA